MAVTATPRFALPQYSAGNDPVITRASFDAAMLSLENLAVKFGSGTLAARPAAAAAVAGMIYTATDLGVRFWCDGASWIAISPTTLLGRLTLDVSIVATGEQTLFTATAPAGLLTSTSDVELEAWGFFENTSGSNKDFTLRFKLGGGTTCTFGPITVASAGAGVGDRFWRFRAMVANQGALATQLIHAELMTGAVGGSGGTARLVDGAMSYIDRAVGAVNTALATSFALTGEISAAAAGPAVVNGIQGALLVARGL